MRIGWIIREVGDMDRLLGLLLRPKNALIDRLGVFGVVGFSVVGPGE